MGILFPFFSTSLELLTTLLPPSSFSFTLRLSAANEGSETLVELNAQLLGLHPLTAVDSTGITQITTD